MFFHSRLHPHSLHSSWKNIPPLPTWAVVRRARQPPSPAAQAGSTTGRDVANMRVSLVLATSNLTQSPRTRVSFIGTSRWMVYMYTVKHTSTAKNDCAFTFRAIQREHEDWTFFCCSVPARRRRVAPAASRLWSAPVRTQVPPAALSPPAAIRSTDQVNLKLWVEGCVDRMWVCSDVDVFHYGLKFVLWYVYEENSFGRAKLSPQIFVPGPCTEFDWAFWPNTGPEWTPSVTIPLQAMECTRKLTLQQRSTRTTPSSPRDPRLSTFTPGVCSLLIRFIRVQLESTSVVLRGRSQKESTSTSLNINGGALTRDCSRLCENPFLGIF